MWALSKRIPFVTWSWHCGMPWVHVELGKKVGGRLLANEIIPLVIGFVLTIVLGGWLGAWLQRRTWDHQNEVQLRQDELRRADDVCHSVSILLDKRLYRMRRFYFALTLDPELPERSERILACLKEYDAVLYEWNDSLNLNLALMGAYFGEGARDWLDFELYEQFKQVGAELEDYYVRNARGSEVEHNLAQIKADLDSLGSQVYQLGVFMMTQLRDGAVGRTAPDRVAASPSPGEVQVPTPPPRV
jgi:hypothetical protein